MEGSTFLTLTQYGVAGVALITEWFVIRQLYKDNRRLQREKDALQDSRRQDAKDTTDRITMPLESISQSIQLIADKIKTSKETQI